MDGIAAETMNRVAKAAEKIEKLEPRLEAARAHEIRGQCVHEQS